jgi:hypothetical protein
VRFEIYEVARDSVPPHFKPSRAQAELANAALWQAAEFVAARVAARSAQEVWAELRRFTGLDDIWGPSIEAWPNDSLLFAVDDGRVLRVYAVHESCCRLCGRPHRDAPADLCLAARNEYDARDARTTSSASRHPIPHDDGTRSEDSNSTASA